MIVAEPGQRRKLAAILSADVVGYSKLMADDESATVATLKEYRATVGRVSKRRRSRSGSDRDPTRHRRTKRRATGSPTHAIGIALDPDE
jgi:hypothetical protein